MTALGPRLRAALLSGRRLGRRGTGSTSLRRSDGYEFAELREYVEGDDPRRIDWAATARAGNVQTRVMLEEYSLFLAVALDGSHSMHVGRTISNYDLACATAELWYAAATDDDRCARLGPQSLVLRNVRGRSGALACASQREPAGTELAPSLRLALATLPRGARLLVIGDFFETTTLEPLLIACSARFDVTILFARDPWRSGLPLGGFVRLRDAENGRVARAFVGRTARANYQGAVAAREAAVLERLRATGARIGVLDESAGAEQALTRTFSL